jgi:hypothetical protein
MKNLSLTKHGRKHVCHPVHICLPLPNFWKLSHAAPMFSRFGRPWNKVFTSIQKKRNETSEQFNALLFFRNFTKFCQALCTRMCVCMYVFCYLTPLRQSYAVSLLALPTHHILPISHENREQFKGLAHPTRLVSFSVQMLPSLQPADFTIVV